MIRKISLLHSVFDPKAKLINVSTGAANPLPNPLPQAGEGTFHLKLMHMGTKTCPPDENLIMTIKRCSWANEANPFYLAYHDHEWGVPCHDETRLFEMLNLEGAQAGLSWETILNKRESYREAFDHWDAEKIARYDAVKVAELLANPGIVRNRLKVAATIGNAQAYLRLCDEVGGLDVYLWGFVNGKTVVNHIEDVKQAPAKTEISERLSKDLAKRGFKFIGPTIIYAYMQAIGMVDDHVVSCFKRHNPQKTKGVTK